LSIVKANHAGRSLRSRIRARGRCRAICRVYATDAGGSVRASVNANRLVRVQAVGILVTDQAFFQIRGFGDEAASRCGTIRIRSADDAGVRAIAAETDGGSGRTVGVVGTFYAGGFGETRLSTGRSGIGTIRIRHATDTTCDEETASCADGSWVSAIRVVDASNAQGTVAVTCTNCRGGWAIGRGSTTTTTSCSVTSRVMLICAIRGRVTPTRCISSVGV